MNFKRSICTIITSILALSAFAQEMERIRHVEPIIVPRVQISIVDPGPLVIPMKLEPIILDIPPLNLNFEYQFGYQPFGTGTCTQTSSNAAEALSALDQGFGSCFAKVKSSDDVTAAGDEPLVSVLDICSCLDQKSTVQPDLRSILNADIASQVKNKDKDDRVLETRVQERLNLLTAQRDAVAFDASVTFNDTSAKVFINDVANLFLNKESKKKAQDTMKDQALRGVGDDVSLSRSQRRQVDRLIDQKAQVEGNEANRQRRGLLLQDNPIAAPQCIGGREFLSFNQFPSDEILYRELQKPFNEADWDYNKVFENYKKYQYAYQVEMAKSEAERNQNNLKGWRAAIIQTKQKLLFLNRNPMMKTIFSMPTDKAAYQNYFEVDKDKKQYENIIKPELIGKKRQELFAKLQTFSKGVNCDNSGGRACLAQALNQSNNFESYKQGLKDFFSDKDTALLMKLGDGQSFVSNFQKLYQRDPNANFETSVKPNQQKTATSLAVSLKEYTGKDPRECLGQEEMQSGRRSPDCLKVFGEYCRQAYNAWITSSEEDYTVKDNLDEQINNSLKVDLSNPDLKEFNKNICNTAHKSSKYPDAMTFFDYQSRHCSGKDAKVCRQEYIRDFDFGEDSSFVKAFDKFAMSKYSPQNVANASEMFSSDSGTKWNDNFRQASRNFFKGDNISESVSQNFVPEQPKQGGGFFGATASALNSVAEGMGANSAASLPGVAAGGTAASYSGAGSTAQVNVPDAGQDTPRVENMNDAEKRDMLAEWKKDYEDWKRNNRDGLQNNPATQAEEARLRAELDALRALTESQTKQNQELFNLVNKTIAQKQAQKNQEEAQQRDVERSQTRFASNGNYETDFSNARAPASVAPSRDQGSSSNGTNSSSGGGVASLGGSQGRNAVRANLSTGETSKVEPYLVVSGNQGQSSQQQQAIQVSLTDEQYRAIQANPSGINLAQLQGRIPQEQIDQLKANGEILIVLKNGDNPAFEVKAALVNNQLVLSRVDKDGKPQEPIRRVSTLSALQRVIDVR